MKFSEGLAHAQIGGRFGFIDKSGNAVVTPQFDDAWDFSDGLALVANGARLLPARPVNGQARQAISTRAATMLFPAN